MEFDKPNKNNFTIYCKSGCPNCLKTKVLLKEKNLIFNVVDCDDYIIEDKENFLLFIKDLSKREIKQFPIIFYAGSIIGGYNETRDYIDKLFLSFDNILDF